MAVSRLMLTTSRTWLLEVPSLAEPELITRSRLSCILRWRQNKLWVSAVAPSQQVAIPALENEQWLRECLEHSPVKAICLNANIGEAGVNHWADVCKQIGKPVYLRLPTAAKRFNRQKLPSQWHWLGWTIDCLGASLLLLLLSPIFLSISLLLWIDSPEPVFNPQWRVGDQGKLFQMIVFHTDLGHQQGDQGLSILPRRWLSQSGLGRLPQLLNVIQRQISLINVMRGYEGLSIAAALSSSSLPL